ncbi:hypothetical protein NPIL_215801 [Nephila pilipes]|uniref:Uncharacterized protein n=1 Tax=Nephila pilipes TaxID=299642 RepID=A0A8X6NEA0_NEPPI|nr:hypothetical protein NPIL_215801 [Nephila pilipes]
MSNSNEDEVLKFLQSQTDSMRELRFRILLLPSAAERIRPNDLPGHQILTPYQRIRIRNLLEDKKHELIRGRRDGVKTVGVADLDHLDKIDANKRWRHQQTPREHQSKRLYLEESWVSRINS